MAGTGGWFRDFPTLGVTCAIVAGGLGLAYMSAAGAPIRYVGINSGALALGLATYALLSRFGVQAGRPPTYVTLLAGLALLSTVLFGMAVEGAARWVVVGPLTVQPSLLLLPAAIVAFARQRDAAAASGLFLAAFALALQPDRAMAGVLAASLLAVASVSRDRWSVTAFAVAACAFAATLLRPDDLPAVPYVDGIFYSAFAIGGMAGAAVVGGALLLLMPAAVGFVRDPENRLVHAAFGATWLGIIAAAALGNYPTPVVGYGGSAILGYLVSLSFMPRPGRYDAGQVRRAIGHRHARDESTSLRLPAAWTT